MTIKRIITPLTGFFIVAVTVGMSLAQSDNSPKLLAAGVISGPADDLSPAFSPDGKTVYFTRGNPNSSVIMFSTLQRGKLRRLRGVSQHCLTEMPHLIL